MRIDAAGPISQIAYVVEDIPAAVEFWAGTMGVGPFLLLADLKFDRSDYRGEERPVTYSAAIAYSGGLNVELIQPDGPSIFEDWMKAGRGGVQHICRFTDDFAASEADLLARGAKRLQGGAIMGGLLAYYDMGGDTSVILELAQLTPEALAMFDAVRAAGEAWDGQARWIDPATLLPPA